MCNKNFVNRNVHASNSRDVSILSAPKRQQELSEAGKHRLNGERKMTQLSSLIMRLKAVWDDSVETYMSHDFVYGFVFHIFLDFISDPFP
jgi:hypothetical protein